MPTAGLSAVARPAAINGPITNTSSSWMASNAKALSSVSSGTSCDHSERIEAEIGGMVAPWSAARSDEQPDRGVREDADRLGAEHERGHAAGHEDHLPAADPVHEPADEAGGHAHRQSLRAHHRSDLPVLIALLAHQEDHGQRHDRERQAPGGGEQRHPGDAGEAQDFEVATQLHSLA